VRFLFRLDGRVGTVPLGVVEMVVKACSEYRVYGIIDNRITFELFVQKKLHIIQQKNGRKGRIILSHIMANLKGSVITSLI